MLPVHESLTLNGMGATRIPRYSPAIEAQMRLFSQRLSEKDRRRYAALEARQLGRGGLTYIARIFSCAQHPMAQGLHALVDPEALKQTRLRRASGSRKPSHEGISGLDRAFLQVLEVHTAGSPMTAAVQWPNLTHHASAERLAADHGLQGSGTVVKRLVRPHDVVRRQAQKRTRPGEGAPRDAQCTHLARRKETYTTQGNPIVSSDTKKRAEWPCLSPRHPLYLGNR